MLCSIVLGMGVPTTANYIIQATISAPALVALGVPKLAAHMFVFYFGIVADITPPVALAAFAGSGIAGSNPMKTGFTATRLGIAAYIVPYMFVLNPILVLANVNNLSTGVFVLMAIKAVVTAFIGMVGLASGSSGFFKAPCNLLERIVLIASGLLLIDPGTLTDIAGIGIMIHPGQYIQMLISQITINIRYSFMSISIGQKADSRFSGIYRWLLGFFITDEIFAVATKEDEIKRSYFAGLATLPYLGWALGTFIGAILGNILPDRLMSALSVAIYGMFVAVVVPEMKKARPVLIVVIIAIILSCLFYYIPLLSKISSGITITIVAITAAIIGSIFFPVSDEADNSNN